MSRHHREFSSFHLASVVFLILFVNNTFTSAFQTASPTTCVWNSLTMQRIARCKNLSIISGSCFSTPTRRKIVSVRQHDIPLLLPQRISIQRALLKRDLTLNVSKGSRTDDSTNADFLSTVQTSLCQDILNPIKESVENVEELLLLIGVSGGCDSMALFHAIHDIINRNKSICCVEKFYKIQLHVVHFDHQQRGSESDLDRSLVENMCMRNNIPFHCYYWCDDNDSKDETIKFSQDIARKWRRDKSISLFSDIDGSNSKPGLILSAHHKDDVEETILLKMMRGVHISNISGMDRLQEIKGIDRRIFIGKPLLDLRKADLQHFLISNEVKWREDQSNTSPKYLRNRVRNELIPLLRDMVGGESVLESRLENVEMQSRKIKKDVMERTKAHLSTTLTKRGDELYFSLPNSRGELCLVEEESLFQWVETASDSQISLSYDKLVSISNQISKYPDKLEWKMSIGSGWNIERKGSVLLLNRDSLSDSTNNRLNWYLLRIEDIKKFDEKTDGIHCLRFYKENGNVLSSDDFLLDCAESHMTSKFTPPWRENPVKLKDFLRGQKIPLHRRATCPILIIETDNASEVAAIYIERETMSNELKSEWVINRKLGNTVEDENIDNIIEIYIKRKGCQIY